MQKKVYCLGFFDSIHRGHRKLISVGKQVAETANCELIVMTFDDGIYRTLGTDFKEIYLLRERKEILSDCGAKVIALPSDRNFLNMTCEDFLKFLEELAPYAIVAGSDYTFARNAVGNVKILCDYFKKRGVKVEIVELLEENGKKISTTNVRRLLENGRLTEANILLGSPFFISGTIVEGRKSGREIGIPTANISFEADKLIPKNGVYTTKTYFDGKSYLSVTNIGTHPTFGDMTVNAETHIIDFDGDIYGTSIKVEFYKYLREISEFPSIDELVAQIKYDIDLTIGSLQND